MKIKKILSLILAFFIGLTTIIPITQAKENPIYRFERYGGVFTLPDNEYEYKLNDVIKYKAELRSQKVTWLVQDWYDSVFENRYKNQTARGFLYVDTTQLPNSGDIVPIFHIKHWDGNRYFDNSPQLHGVGIFYDPSKKHIFAFAGNSNKTYDGESARFILYENVDYNTPNFMMYVWASSFGQYRGSDNVPHLSYTLAIFRETEIGNGIIRSGQNKDIFMGYDRLVLNDWDTNLFINTFAEMQQHTMNGNILNPWNLCSDIFEIKTEYSSPEYRSCIQEMSDQINFTYMDTWRDKYGLSVNKENIDIHDGSDTQIGGIDGKFGMIKKIDMIKPQAPTCSFSDSFLGLSCLGEWLSYSFQNLIYFFVSIYNGLVDFFNAIISFVVNFFKNLFDGIKEIFVWLFESIKNLPPIKWVIDTFHPFLKVLYDYFMSYFTPIWDIFTGKTNLQNIVWGNQEYICSKEPSNFIIENTTPAGKKPMEALGAFLYFINPIPPQEGSYICTGLGMKRIEYGKNTILDVFLFNIFIFAGIWFAFIGLRRYN